MSYIEENSNKNNKQSIQILRGSNDTIANSEDKLLDGQLLYNKDKNYITVGNNNKPFNAQPICVRELSGVKEDDSSISKISSSSPYDPNFFIKTMKEKNGDKHLLKIWDSYDVNICAGNKKENPSASLNMVETGEGSIVAQISASALNSDIILQKDKINISSTGKNSKIRLEGNNIELISPTIEYRGSSNSVTNIKFDFTNIPTITLTNANLLHPSFTSISSTEIESGIIKGQLGTEDLSTRHPIYCTSISSTEIESGTIKGQLGTEDPSTRHSIYCTSINCSSITSTGVVTVNNNIKCGDKITLNSTTGEITAQSFNARSDARLKTNIKPLTYHDSILDIPVREYDWKESGKHAIGFIAQELKEVYPELVDENEEGILSIKETKLVYLLIEEVKKLKEEIQELKK